MDVSVWWVLVGAAGGLCVGIVLFAVLTMASRDTGELDLVSDAHAPTRT